MVSSHTSWDCKNKARPSSLAPRSRAEDSRSLRNSEAKALISSRSSRFLLLSSSNLFRSSTNVARSTFSSWISSLHIDLCTVHAVTRARASACGPSVRLPNSSGSAPVESRGADVRSSGAALSIGGPPASMGGWGSECERSGMGFGEVSPGREVMIHLWTNGKH